MRYPALAAAVCALSMAWAVTAHGQEPGELQVGDMAPEFSLPGSDGKTWTLSELRGTTVVLAWFPMAFSGGWTAECKSLRASGDEIRKYDVVYFAASVDEPEVNRKFAESVEANYPILSDPGKSTARAYGVVTDARERAYRWTFYIGPDGRIQYIDKKVSTATAGEDVVKRLEALGVEKRSAGP